MAILKKTTIVAKPAAKPTGKPVVKATMQTIMVDKKTGKETKSAPVAMKSKSITAKEFNTDGKAAKAMAKKEPTFTETVKRKIKQGTAYEMARNIKNDLVKPVAKVMRAKYDETFGEMSKPKKKK